jgi:glucose/arabinose dehydrogenase
MVGAPLLLLGLIPIDAAPQKLPRPLITGLIAPVAQTVWNGKVYLCVYGDAREIGAASIVEIRDGKAVPIAVGLDFPMGLVGFQQSLFVIDGGSIRRVDAKGMVATYVAEEAFPRPPRFLRSIDADEVGNLYVTDLGDSTNKNWCIFRIDLKKKVIVIADDKRSPGVTLAHGVVMDGQAHLLTSHPFANELRRFKIADGTSTIVAAGIPKASELAWDRFGRLFVSTQDLEAGKIYGVARPDCKPVLLASGFENPGLGVDPTGKNLLITQPGKGTLTILPATIAGHEVDDSPLPVETAVAFPDVKWAGWDPEAASGKVRPFRPVLLTHAGDGSNRVFVGTQQGVVHVFPNDPKATASKVFLDIQDRVAYNDNTNEEGFLGLAFHPRFKTNGEFFVFYTLKKHKQTNLVSRFRLSKDDPTRADPASEEEVFRIANRPFWNHDGGTICFGPDGFLYLTHGDGGDANDPFDNGQNLGSLLGKIHRIDVDHKDPGKNYAVPRDNPFADRKGARPEIWAYGLRNVWRMAFDRKTGQLWAADVGQNLYEEINLITRGGNYGWNRREGLHPFGIKGLGPGKELIEPIWEYHHDVGKSITGGAVYRGERLPELAGLYLYGDYVTGRIWGLCYDESRQRVTANRPIRDKGFPIYSFGEDEKGEVYLLTQTTTGKGIYWFVKSDLPKR